MTAVLPLVSLTWSWIFQICIFYESVTSVLHFINITPINWYSKRQGTVGTPTYGSELVAARTATEQIMDLKNTLRYLGAPIMTKAYMFGDNKSLITSVTISQSVLNKRHNMLSYHRVREAIAGKICTQQKAQHVVIPQSERSHCRKDPRLLLVFI